MRDYSIVRIGNAYIVKANEKGVLKIASRRRAARLVSDAVELLMSHAALPASEQAPPKPASACNSRDHG
jgi:hypothetical protein